MGASHRRYFEGMLLLLLAVGFATLASTGRLAWPVVAVAGAAYAARALSWWRRREFKIAPAVWAAGLLLYLPFYIGDGLLLSHSFLTASLHLVVLAAAARLFAPWTARNALMLGVFAFLEVLAAAMLTVSGVFFMLFLLFLVLLVATLVAHEMARAEAAHALARPAAPLAPLLRFSLLLSLAVAGCGVLIFFLLPRIAVDAWAGHPGATGLSGFSDEVRLGAIADLQRSDTPVMHVRVVASDPVLTPAEFQQVPWRGRGLTDFDGQRWFSPSTPALFGTQSGQIELGLLSARGPSEIVRYQVTLEPMNSPVLFFPARLLRASTHFPVLAWDRATGTLASLGADFAGTAYSGVSDLARPSPEELRAAPPPGAFRYRYGFADYLQLPDNLDPRIPALARYIVFHSPGDEYDELQALSQYLQSHYQYSLEELPQGADPLAAFLFDQPAGDCEYFASALAVMARTLGIPTRVVNGFVLGAYNPLSGEYIVRGRDAHTWVEAYFPAAAERAGRGFQRGGEWVSFDATPSAAPAGADAWPGAGLALDALSSLWQEWIVNYDWLQQARLVRHVQTTLSDGAGRVWENGGAAAGAAWASLSAGVARLGGAGPWRWPELLGSLGLVALLGWAGRERVARWAFRSAADGELGQEVAIFRARRAYRRFQSYLARAGVRRKPHQTSEELLAQVAAARPGSPLLASATAFVADYQALRFDAGLPAVAELSRKMLGHLAQVRRYL